MSSAEPTSRNGGIRANCKARVASVRQSKTAARDWPVGFDCIDCCSNAYPTEYAISASLAPEIPRDYYFSQSWRRPDFSNKIGLHE